jgi:hypothetical protein
MWKYNRIFTVPTNLIIIVGRMIEEKWIRCISRKAREPFIHIEGQPLGRTEYCIRRIYLSEKMIMIKHFKIII